MNAISAVYSTAVRVYEDYLKVLYIVRIDIRIFDYCILRFTLALMDESNKFTSYTLQQTLDKLIISCKLLVIVKSGLEKRPII